MAVTKYTQEIKVSVTPKRMFNAMVIESYNLLPKIMPAAIKSIQFLHGDGDVCVGTISQTNFPDGFVKHKVDAVDVENCTTKYSLIEGAWLGDKLESVNYDVKFEGSGDGGCVIKITSECHSKGDDVVFKEEEIEAGKDKLKGFYTAAEEYLIANPNVCA